MGKGISVKGRLVADPELARTPEGLKVATFHVEEETEAVQKGKRIPIVALGAQAEYADRHLKAGCRVVVEGRAETRPYIDKDGHKRAVAEVLATAIYHREPEAGA